MATRTDRRAAAEEAAAGMRRTIGEEIRKARRSAGTSLVEAAALAGMSHAQLSRIERGRLPTVSVDQLARACAAVGLRLVARAEVGAGPAVDSGQLAILARFPKLLPNLPPLAREVPFPNPGDARAWDAMLRLETTRVAFEAEARLRDAQALDRRCQIKLRDGAADVLILLVNDTAHNRAFLAEHREALRSTFPLDGRQILRSLRAGKAPEQNGMLMI
ncbi:MAG TPA: helix-turn-helix transcriptional regulator [Candidatus Limnocylindrales bacterium]|nr:helix-turn-helix transcriptional regulator [Candidatus Limnocylindrales bacterium]